MRSTGSPWSATVRNIRLFCEASRSNAFRSSERQPVPLGIALSDGRQRTALAARASIEKGAVTPAYQGNIQTIDILQTVLATEIVCVLRYTMNTVVATGLSSE